jgi:hypothetical protein
MKSDWLGSWSKLLVPNTEFTRSAVCVAPAIGRSSDGAARGQVEPLLYLMLKRAGGARSELVKLAEKNQPES